MLFLLPSEDADFVHCYRTNLHLVLLHLVLVTNKLAKLLLDVFIYSFWIPSARVL